MSEEAASGKITFAVVYHNEEKNISHLLESVESEINESSKLFFKFLFIDNRSDDQSSEIIQSWAKSQPELSTKNINRDLNHMAEARQQALETSDTEWIVFVDADSTLKPMWFESLLRTIGDIEDNVVVVGGGSEYLETEGWHKFVTSIARYFPMGKKQSQRAVVNHVPTNNYLVNRVQALRAGGFDSFFKRVGEDLDINVRLKKQGQIIYEPRFSVFHNLPKSSLHWYGKMALYGRAQSFVFLKYGGAVPKEKFIPLILVIILNLGLAYFPRPAVIIFSSLLIIPRSRFFTLTFLFYGLGEFVGVFKYLFVKSFVGSFFLKKSKA